MLEGNELEKEYDGGAGKLILDVTDKGEVKFSNTYEKSLGGYATVKSVTEINSNIFMIAYIQVKKTGATWDDALVEGLAKLLGIPLPDAQAMAAQIKVD
jgi:hypothetical protein